MVIPSLIDEFYRERIEDDVTYMRYLARDIGAMNRIREAYGGEDWEISELTRHIVFLENQISQSLMEEIEHDRETIRELKKRDDFRALEGPAGI
jgi:hypothetical protein